MISKFTIKRYLTLTSTLLMAILISDCSHLIKSRERIRFGQALYTKISESEIPWTIRAESVDGREIYLLELGDGDSTTLIFGGFHGS